MIVDADMQTPLALQIRAPKAVTKKKEMDKDDEEDDGLVIECDGDKISKFESSVCIKTFLMKNNFSFMFCWGTHVYLHMRSAQPPSALPGS